MIRQLFVCPKSVMREKRLFPVKFEYIDTCDVQNKYDIIML